MSEILEQYPEWVKPGAVFFIVYSSGNNPNNKANVHVRAIVDDRLVLRYYSRRRGWHYWVEDIVWFSFNQANIVPKSRHLRLKRI